MINVYIIGVGGVGGYLAQLIPQCMAALSVDIVADRCGKDKAAELMRNAGNVQVPCIIDSLTLIDGDSFDPHNCVRQAAGTGSKIAVHIKALRESMLKKVWLRYVKLAAYNTYVKPENLANIIPKKYTSGSIVQRGLRRTEYDNIYSLTSQIAYRPNIRLATAQDSFPIVFMCVDNHKTRYEVCKYLETFDNCILINAGNAKTTGHVTFYQRKDGSDLDPKLYEMYPEIADPKDLRPDETPCTDVAPENDQLAIVNSILASIMANMFSAVMRNLFSSEDITCALAPQVATLRNGPMRVNEVLVDMDRYSMSPMSHNKK